MGVFNFITDKHIESLPNIKTKTLGGEVFWDTIKTFPGGYRVQRHSIDVNHYRILNSNDERISYGSKQVIENYINNHFHTSGRIMKRGDVIAVDRLGELKLYQHFGIYVGNGQVIHYNCDEKSSHVIDKIPFIHRATVDDFISNSKNIYVLDFDEINKESWQFRGIILDGNSISSKNNIDVFSFLDINRIGKELSKMFACKMINEITKTIENQEYHLYSPEETIRRAESKIGQKKYDLFFNNCEHFAIWCKTGLHNSEQIDKLLNANIWRKTVV